jgi:GNAT superfamily N-acetyltransferase
VAKDADGTIIGVTTPYIDENGIQHVGSLYTDKRWHGKGVGAKLMEKVIAWSDPTKPIELGVATYNERAKAFYRKWEFEEIPGSDMLFDDKIPEIKMIRKGDEQ